MGLTLNQYLNKDRKSEIINFFDNIHKEIENRYKLKLGNQKTEAQTLQLFFKKVQYIQNKLLNTKVTTQAGKTVGWGSTAIIDKTSGIKANQQIVKEISEKFSDKFLVRVAAEALGERSTKNIFARAATDRSDNLERPIANLALSLYQNALGSLNEIGKDKKEQIAHIQVGTKATNLQGIDIGKEVRDLPDKMFRALTQKIKLDANKMFQALRNDPLEQNFVYTNNLGKVDITGLNLNINFNFMADAGPLTKKALNIINRSKLSLKNYQSEWDVHLGNTDAWKAFSTPLLALNKNIKDILDAFIAPDLKQFSKNQQALNAHINHVRFVYELSGLGQDANTEADFILINKPNTNEIYVFAVSELILQQMNIKTSAKQLKSFSIPQSSFRKT